MFTRLTVVHNRHISAAVYSPPHRYRPGAAGYTVNKADIDRRPQTAGSYFKRPESSPVRPLACNWYYCAQFVAKPKAQSTLRFSWAATSSNLGL